MITFIIPTIGRPTLQRTIDSLLNQKNKNWKAIVAFDGIPAIEYDDPRIKSISLPKTGKLNHAGQVRNTAIEMTDTEWVGFVDDDDTISKDYVEKIEQELKQNPSAKCIIFRMRFLIGSITVMPEPHHDNFYITRVGISFAMRKDLNMLFEPSSTEDFNLLNRIRAAGNKIIISPFVTYFVRNNPVKMPIYKKIIIN
jgi:glycosyltransferase involved in cell wall biosynthesis